MSFQMDLSQELQSLFDISEDLFSDMTEKSTCFPEVITEAALEKQRIQRIPKKTRQNNQFAVNVWVAWATNRNKRADMLLDKYQTVPLTFKSISNDELDFWMSRFVNEARRKDGSKYPPNTVYNIVAGIQKHIREECSRPEINIFSDSNFANFRATLDAVMKERVSEGIGVVKHTQNVTIDDKNELWEKGVINKTTAKGLSYGVFFYNSKVFGLRGLSEHKELQAQQFTISTDRIIYNESMSKTVKGGLKDRKLTPKTITQFSNPQNPRCVVDLFTLYLSSIPNKGPFYRRPLPPGKENIVKFSSQVVGINTLGKYMQSMFDDAGIDKKVVNHSGRVYCCSTLYNAGFEEQEVMKRSGHRSSAVRTYKRASEEKEKEISNALQPPAPKVQRCIESESAPATIPPSTLTSGTSKGQPSNVLRLEIPLCIDTIVISKNGKDITLSI
ncbi:zinc finger MYM-type protein 2-like [Saccostrea cucullata]|uniref:zinc finger MYM-type protein 2-like n=1 Tax=Saccostrea cuccullata TaxID=36930 RepID=UPI002ED4D15E